LVLADGTMATCSLGDNSELFRAALVSLGSLGIIIRLTMRASPKFNLSHTTETIPLSRFLAEYETIWSSATYVRVWWWPYTRKVIVWRANRTQSPETPSSTPTQSPLAKIGRTIYESSLYTLRYSPSLLPTFEKALFRCQFPAKENVISETTVSNTHQALQMDCYFSQYVDEWAIPLKLGIEAISRLDKWISLNDFSAETGIPVPTDKRVYVHAPLEIRVASGHGDHAYLSAVRKSTPVVYIGVLMYRPYFTPTTYRRYFLAYEHLMRSLGGIPHWAKQHGLSADEAKQVFGEGLQKWLEVRGRVDPTGVFVNGFVKRHLLGTSSTGKENIGVGIWDGESGRRYKRFRAVL
jgi:D-arabinono-1,4-lactone oxidase